MNPLYMALIAVAASLVAFLAGASRARKKDTARIDRKFDEKIVAAEKEAAEVVKKLEAERVAARGRRPADVANDLIKDGKL